MAVGAGSHKPRKPFISKRPLHAPKKKKTNKTAATQSSTSASTATKGNSDAMASSTTNSELAPHQIGLNIHVISGAAAGSDVLSELTEQNKSNQILDKLDTEEASPDQKKNKKSSTDKTSGKKGTGLAAGFAASELPNLDIDFDANDLETLTRTSQDSATGASKVPDGVMEALRVMLGVSALQEGKKASEELEKVGKILQDIDGLKKIQDPQNKDAYQELVGRLKKEEAKKIFNVFYHLSRATGSGTLAIAPNILGGVANMISAPYQIAKIGKKVAQLYNTIKPKLAAEYFDDMRASASPAEQNKIEVVKKETLGFIREKNINRKLEIARHGIHTGLDAATISLLATGVLAPLAIGLSVGKGLVSWVIDGIEKFRAKRHIVDPEGKEVPKKRGVFKTMGLIMKEDYKEKTGKTKGPLATLKYAGLTALSPIRFAGKVAYNIIRMGAGIVKEVALGPAKIATVLTKYKGDLTKIAHDGIRGKLNVLETPVFKFSRWLTKKATPLDQKIAKVLGTSPPLPRSAFKEKTIQTHYYNLYNSTKNPVIKHQLIALMQKMYRITPELSKLMLENRNLITRFKLHLGY